MVIMTRSRANVLEVHEQELPILSRIIKQEPATLEMASKNKRPGRRATQSPSPGGQKESPRKSIRPVDRERMKSWLVKKLNDKELPQHLWWKEGEERTVFHVRWPHAARQGFSASEDAKLFKAWAIHSGIYMEGDEEDHKKWKSNFRCAIHSLPDVVEETIAGQKKGSAAMRTYRFLDKPREKRNKKCRKNQVACKKQERTCSSDYSESDICQSPTPQTPPSNAAVDPTQLLLDVKREEDASSRISTTFPDNVPNFSSLGLSTKIIGNFQTVNLGFQSGGTFTVRQESAEGDRSSSTAQAPIICWKAPISIISSLSPEMLDSIEDIQDVPMDSVDLNEEDAGEMLIPVELRTVHNPSTRMRTPSGDSGHPDSPPSNELFGVPPWSSTLPGVVEFDLPEGCVLQVTDCTDEGVEFTYEDESIEVLDISGHQVIDLVESPVAVEEVHTIDNEFNYTGLGDAAMETA